jgi:uncharacterized repeat protein (TIGR02543 family)
MRKRSGLFLVLLLSALMVFGVFGLAAYADDGAGDAGDNWGIRSSEHQINIHNSTGKVIKVLGLKDGADFSWEQIAGSNEPYTTPDVITYILTKEPVGFRGLQPYYELEGSFEEGYKYCVVFLDGNDYEGVVNLEVVEAPDTVLLTFNSNDGCGYKTYMATGKNKDAYLKANEFEREGYEFLGWSLDPNATEPKYEDGALVNPSKDYQLYAVWKHVHKWEIVDEQKDSVTIECVNPGCEFDEPFKLTLTAGEDKIFYDGLEHGVILEGSENLPEGAVTVEPATYKRNGASVDSPVDAGIYTATVNLTVNDGEDTEVSLRKSFIIFRNGRFLVVDMDSYKVGEKPAKASIDPIITPESKKQLFFYVKEENAYKTLITLGKLINKNEITIDDFKGLNPKLLPPIKEGAYAAFVVGLSRNHIEIGYKLFSVDPQTGVTEATIEGWPYGQFDPEVNTPKVTVDGNEVPEGALSYEYKPLFDDVEAYQAFNPVADEANKINAGVYILKAHVNDNDAVNPDKTGYAIFSVGVVDAVKTDPTAKEGLVADGTDQELVNAGTSEDGTYLYFVTSKNIRKLDEMFFKDVPTAKYAGTYYVWYVFDGDINHNSELACKPIKVVIAPEESVDPDESGEVDPSGGDADPSGGDSVEPGDGDADEVVDVPCVKKLTLKAGKKYIKASWNKVRDIKAVSYIEVTYKTGINSKGKTVKISKAKSSYKIKGLKRNTKYYVDVHYVKIVDGKKYRSEEKLLKIRTK